MGQLGQNNEKLFFVPHLVLLFKQLKGCPLWSDQKLVAWGRVPWFELWASAFAPHLVALYPVPRTMHQCFIVQLMIRGGVRVRACSQ